MGTRTETLINESVTLGFRHTFNGTLMDAYSVSEVRIYNPLGTLVSTITSITHNGLGSYQVVAPGSLFTQPGHYRDVWVVQPTSTSSTRAFDFDINVVTALSPANVNFDDILEGCTLSELDACKLKKFYLFPVATALQNYYLPDSVLQYHIDNAMAWMSRTLGIPLRQKRVLTAPYGDGWATPPVKGVDYDEDGDLQQWSIVSGQWANVRVPHSGLISVSGLRGVYGGNVVYHIPLSWIDRNFFSQGFVRVRPTTAGIINTLIDSSGNFLETTLLEALGQQTVPGFWAIDYTYGQKDNKFSREICALILKKAATLLLAQLGMVITRGIQSKSASVDGLSGNISFIANAERSIFGSLQATYEAEFSPDNLLELRRYHKGPVTYFI